MACYQLREHTVDEESNVVYFSLVDVDHVGPSTHPETRCLITSPAMLVRLPHLPSDASVANRFGFYGWPMSLESWLGGLVAGRMEISVRALQLKACGFNGAVRTFTQKP